MDNAHTHETLDRGIALLTLLKSRLLALEAGEVDAAAGRGDIDVLLAELAKLERSLLLIEAEARRRRSEAKRRGKM